MATRVSKHGSYRYDRRFPPPVGRYAIATGAKTKAEYRQRAALLDELYRGGMFDVLEAVRRRSITFEELLDAKRRKVPLETYVGGITLRRSLREAVDGWVPHSAKAERTRKRYKLSLDYLLDPANGFLFCSMRSGIATFPMSCSGTARVRSARNSSVITDW